MEKEVIDRYGGAVEKPYTMNEGVELLFEKIALRMVLNWGGQRIPGLLNPEE
ncbi:MAG: hypothetical protein GY860_00865 [Desulfobacteraceae bacterium]|nr:hypothetical protein [Desulfobacteraceae bacterium]